MPHASLEVRVISIGAIDAHPLWDERSPARTGHSTTSLIRLGKTAIIVDPGLPAAIVAARLSERSDLKPEQVTHVFLTSFRPDVRRGIRAFENAAWLISEAEREAVGVPLIHELQNAADRHEHEQQEMLEQEVALLKRCEAAPDRLAPGVSLFPLHGVTPGLTGLIIEQARHTTLVCGDAIPTIEHLEMGQAPKDALNVTQARESFAEAIEIADLLILGRDNMVVNPVKRPF